MKNVLLLLVSFSIVLVSHGQVKKDNFKKASAKAENVLVDQPTSSTGSATFDHNVTPPLNAPEGAKVVNQIPLGQSGNAFGFFVDSRTASVWVNEDLNAVAFTHRLAVPSSSYIGYDVSFNRGTTWSLDQVNYNPTLPGASNARYPMGGIYNPAGNTNPDNAFHTYVAPVLDGSQGVAASWGGIAYGAKAFAAGATPVQQIFTTTSADERFYLPSAFAVTQQGHAFFADQFISSWDGTTSTYGGSITIGKGTFDDGTGTFVYDNQAYPLEINVDDGINDIELAFAPDGQTGYMVALTNLPTTLPFTSYHPIISKTTDGGETWGDPIEVQLGGAAGLAAVKNFITDEALLAFYDPNPVPSREEIPYYAGYYLDLTVDAWGNPHIITNVMLADLEAGSIYTGADYNAIFHIWSNDGGLTWESYKLSSILQSLAEFTGGGSTVSHRNRCQASTTTDGTIVFFSWLDSDVPDAVDNTRPDIYFMDYVPYQGGGTHGEKTNVTLFSAAMWTANWATMPQYVFSSPVGTNSVECTIPWVYQKLNAENNPSVAVQFYYIPDFKKTYTITSTPETATNLIASVGQNYPNPFAGETTVSVTLAKSANVVVEIFNLTGQKVYSNNFGQLPSGPTALKIRAENLNTGVYFYTVEAGNSKVTRKMIVK